MQPRGLACVADSDASHAGDKEKAVQPRFLKVWLGPPAESEAEATTAAEAAAAAAKAKAGADADAEAEAEAEAEIGAEVELEVMVDEAMAVLATLCVVAEVFLIVRVASSLYR